MPQLSQPDDALPQAKGSEERWDVLGSTLIAERRVVELEQQIGRQRAALDQFIGAGQSEREIDLARSALTALESRLRFAQNHLRFERTHYSLFDNGRPATGLPARRSSEVKCTRPASGAQRPA